MEIISKLFFKYCVYYPALLLRKEWFGNYKLFLEKSQYDSHEALKDRQLEKLNIILGKARQSRFYQSRGCPEHVKSWAQVNSISLLSKDDLREHIDDMLTESPGLFYTTKTSGGSTGAPVRVRKPARAMAREYASAWRGYSWAGVEVGDLQARFWGVPLEGKSRVRAKLVDMVTRRSRFSAFKFKSSDLDSYLEKLSNKSRNLYFYGYTSMIYELANRVMQAGSTGVKPKAIIVTSEVLTPALREVIEKAFECRVYNEYGCGEVGTIAHECEYGSLHVNMENVLVEILDDNGSPVKDGEVGEITVTDLNNDLSPLIRYSLKDFGSMSKSSCACGRTLEVLNDLKGRAYDFIENEVGEKFHGEFFLYIVEDLHKRGIQVGGIQFVKEGLALKINIAIESSKLSEASAYIVNKLNSEFSNKIEYEINAVDSIKREKSGKIRVIKNN